MHAAGDKPSPNFGGVQVGAITYSWRSMPGAAEDIIRYCIQAGISSIELMGYVAEQYAGIPSGPPRPPRGATLTEEQRAAFKRAAAEAAEARRKWRLSAPTSTPPDTNQVWGKGETPLANILKLVQRQKWPIYCDIELEYDVPVDSDAAKEVKKCVDFAKSILI